MFCTHIYILCSLNFILQRLNHFWKLSKQVRFEIHYIEYEIKTDEIVQNEDEQHQQLRQSRKRLFLNLLISCETLDKALSYFAKFSTSSSAEAKENRNGTVFSYDFQLLAYTDDTDIIRHTKWHVIAAFSAIKREFADMSPSVDEGKTKYMLWTNRNIHITVVTSKNFVSLVNKRRIQMLLRF